MGWKIVHLWLLAVVLLLVSCGGHTHAGGNMFPVDSLCMGISKERYSSIERHDSLVAELVAVPGIGNETEMVANNAMAYSAMMRMDYGRSVELYNIVLEESQCEIERLVADVGLMTLCYRVSANRQFFDCRANALSRIRRIDEEYSFLSDGDRERFNRARVEFDIASVCYFSNLAMRGEAAKVLGHLENNMESSEESSLRLYARMILANNNPEPEERLSSLSMGLGVAEKSGFGWLKGNYSLLLAIVLRDSSMQRLFADRYPERTALLLSKDTRLEELPRLLAHKAAEDFRQYGDEYMMVEALAVEASCNTWLGRYNDALQLLSDAYGRIDDYYLRNYGINADTLLYASDGIDSLVSDIEGGVFHLPECLLSVCREASCAYAGLGELDVSYVNRDIYLELLRTTRLNKQLESRISGIEVEAVRLKAISVVLFVLLVAFSLFLILVHRRRMQREKTFSMQRKHLLKVCRMLLSSLPHDIDNKQGLFDSIAALLNENMGNFSGKTVFVLSEKTCGTDVPYMQEFELRYMNSAVCDRLSVVSEEPLDNDKMNLMAMLVPYVAVAVEEGLRLSGISEDCEKLEELKRASAIYIAEHKRENVQKRVSVSIVSGMRPFMDRITNELKHLSGDLPDEDCKRKLEYVSELTEKLEDLNVILERWIKTRQGELNLRIENFAVAELFAIIGKSRNLFDARGIVLTVRPAECVVKADRALTLFMINTLVDNAAKFTLTGGHVVLETLEENGAVEIVVTDTGIGMSQEDVDCILDSKVYDASKIGADNSLMKPRSKGNGFGLMNCKGIIEKYRKTDPSFSVCSFNIKSTEGVGSRFSFTLPKGIIRLLLILVLVLPLQLSANDCLFGRLNEYADSVFMCNVNGNHEDAFAVAQDALDLLNVYYRENIGGNDTLSLCSGNAAELAWWRNSLCPDSLKAQIYYNILDIRNEVAVASLALNRWGAYRYNNYIYSTLYRLVDEDKGVADRYDTMKQSVDSYKVAIAISCFLILLLLIYYLITFVRHNVIECTNERLVLDMNNRLLTVAARGGRRSIGELAQDIVNELYTCMGETMRIKHVALLLDCVTGGGKSCAAAPGDDIRDDRYMEHVLESGSVAVLSSGMERVMPLFAVNDGECLSVGVLKVVTERPLSDNEVVSLELVSNYLASVAYHSAVRVARGYMELEELEEEAERISYEENRMHVQNMVMDNCLSVIKHETVYYPSRIKELAEQALSPDGNSASAVSDMRELMDYYSSVFGILSNCALRELDGAGFSFSKVELKKFFEKAKVYVGRMAKKRGSDVALVYEETDCAVMVDSDLVEYLFEQLLSAALVIEKNGTLMMRAQDAGDVVKVELVDNRHVMTSDAATELFTPTRGNINASGGVNSMEYLVAKEIVRLHEDFTGKHGGRMEARSDISGTVILFTLPK